MIAGGDARVAADTPDAVCIGNIVADVFCPPIEALPRPGTVSIVKEIELLPGGCASNTAIDLAKIGLRAGLLGKVGGDQFGEFVLGAIGSHGVDTSRVRLTDSSPTSSCVIILCKGEDRRYIHCLGANAELRPSDIDVDYVLGARALSVGGFLSALPVLKGPSLRGVLKKARQHGVITILDVVGGAGRDAAEQCRRVLPEVDVFLPNTDEARAITGVGDPAEQADRFLEWGAGMAVITLGKGGVFLKTRGGRRIRASAYAVDTVDPSGAGDAFDAGFIAGLLSDWDLAQTVKFASAVAASCVMAVGANRGIVSMERTLSFMRENDSIRIECQ